MPNTYRNIHLIYNPTAGKLQRGSVDVIGKAAQILESQGQQVTLAPTAAPQDARNLARHAIDTGADLVLVAGGDGTINEALNGMVPFGVPMGVLPLGTANVLATELGLAKSTEEVAAMIPDLVPERISVGFLQTADEPSRYFVMMAGIGLDAHIVVNIDKELKRKFGKLAYWIGGFGQLGQKFPEFDVTVGEETVRSSFTLAARVRNYGGDIAIAKSACLLDDYFEVVAFEGEDSFQYLKYLTGVLANLLDEMKGVTIRRAREVELTSSGDSDVYVQVDGEAAGKLPATIEIVPDALTLLIPAEFRRTSAATP